MSTETGAPTTEELQQMDNDKLIAAWHRASVIADEANLQMGRIEMVLIQHLETDEATEYVTKHHVARIENTYGYDDTRLLPIFEFVEKGEMVKKGAYAEAYKKTEWVPASFNKTKLKPFGKRAGVQAVIDSARYVKSRKLVIAPRE